MRNIVLNENTSYRQQLQSKKNFPLRTLLLQFAFSMPPLMFQKLFPSFPIPPSKVLEISPWLNSVCVIEIKSAKFPPRRSPVSFSKRNILEDVSGSHLDTRRAFWIPALPLQIFEHPICLDRMLTLWTQILQQAVTVQFTQFHESAWLRA